VQNKDNSIFRIQYRFDRGTWNNKKLDLAAQYLQFLSTDKMSAEDISKAFYKIACSFSISAGKEFTTVKIEGLQENFTQAVSLFEHLLKNCKPNESALSALKARIAKSRTDAKSNKSAIMSGLTAYARYGQNNPFNYVISDTDLNQTTSAELISILHGLNNYSHKIIYYGPQTLVSLKPNLQKLHTLPTVFTSPEKANTFTYDQQTNNKVLFADYDMVQAEIRWIRNTNIYNAAEEPTIAVFNNYFGSGMSGLVFQTIRESKALAYSTFAYYVSPDKKEDPYFSLAYVGCQADKFNEAIGAMNELLTQIPYVTENLNNARAGIKKDIETARITQDGIIFNYLDAQRKGLNQDIRQKTYASVNEIEFKQIEQFHNQYLSKKPYTYCVVASEKKVSEKDMAKYGQVHKLSLEEIFGY
jgi:predicted Zn-dependent peptidase